MKKIRKTPVYLVLLIFLLQIMPFAGAAGPVETAPVRVVNLVYDDSGSMITTNDQLVDTWCQAKYAMEVFAALLGSNDTLNIYVMSDFDNGRTSSPPKLVLHGSDGQSENVAKVHNMITAAGNTPFNSVRKAYADLTGVTADEKWLVVLTDGAFQGVDSVDQFFAQKAEDVKVMYLAMGPSAPAITANEASGIYFEKAETSDQILSEITGICTRIFNNNRLDITLSDKTVSFDVPMAELVVFIQGSNAKIQGITDEEGNKYTSSSAPVVVQYSETASTNYGEFIVAKNLKGSIASFEGDFAPGTYQIDVSGADTIEVYYRPNVEIAAYLTDSSGEEVTDLANLRAGEYTIDFAFVKKGTSDQIGETRLLGDVSYSAVVTNNGITHDRTYSSGDRISIEEGSLEISATAYYLEYNSVSTQLSYSIFEDKALDISILGGPEYTVTKEGIENPEPFQVKITCEGEDITEEQWAVMELVEVSAPEQEEFSFVVAKSAVPGVYDVQPVLDPEALSAAEYSTCAVAMRYQNTHGEAVWYGEDTGELGLADGRSWLDRALPLMIKGGICLAVLALVLGYLPPIKKYLPKQMKRAPGIKCSPNSPLVKPMNDYGFLKKDKKSTFLPYVAQKGTLRFVPFSSHAVGTPAAKLKAAGGYGVFIMNAEDFAGKKHILFDSTPIPAGTTKPVRRSAGMMIKVKTTDVTYTCIPTKK